MANDHDGADRADGVSESYQDCPVCGEAARPRHGADPSDPCRVENHGEAGGLARADIVKLHAETSRFVEAGDIDGLAAAMRADADGLAERLSRRARAAVRHRDET